MRNRIALALVLVSSLALTACGRNTREEIKIRDGEKFLCTWTEPGINPSGTKQDYRCEAFQD